MNPYWGNFYYYTMQPLPRYCISKKEVDLKSQMRRLWGEHVAWIRATITSLVFDLPDASFVVNRLLKTATDMGNSLRPFYGNQVGDAYGQLLREHITLAGDLIKAAKEGNTEKAKEIENSWYRNGDEISVFLNHINPYISLPEFKKMFHEHLDMSKQQVVSMMNKDFAADIAVSDMMLTEGLEIAHIISGAIILQFPSIFI